MTQMLAQPTLADARREDVNDLPSSDRMGQAQAQLRWLKRTGRTREDWSALWESTLLENARQLDQAFDRLWHRPTDETPHIDVATQASLDRRAIYDHMLASFRTTFPDDLIGQELVETRFDAWMQEPLPGFGKTAAEILRAQIQSKMTVKVVEAIS